MVGFDNHSQLRFLILGACGCAWLCTAGIARADYKAFAHVYPYFTQPQGGKEIEIWTSLETGDLSNFAATTLIQQNIELEYGITDHWDVSFYSIFQQAPQEDYRLDAFSLETRYRFAERGQWPVDTEVYLEFERPTDFNEPSEIEGKLILQKGYKRLFTQLNLISEFKLTNGQQYGYLLGADGGLGFEVTPAFRFGVEYLLDFQQVDRLTPATGSFYLGPSLALASPSFWMVVTPAFKVAGTSPDADRGDAMRLRVILGIPLD
jgi:hypothetical protein